MCLFSYRRLEESHSRHKLPAVIFSEDDAEFFPSFKTFYFRELLQFLQRCDIVKFEGIVFRNTFPVRPDTI